MGESGSGDAVGSEMKSKVEWRGQRLVSIAQWSERGGAYTVVLDSIPSGDTDFFSVRFPLPRGCSVTSSLSQLIFPALSLLFIIFLIIIIIHLLSPIAKEG